MCECECVDVCELMNRYARRSVRLAYMYPSCIESHFKNAPYMVLTTRANEL